MHDAKNEYLVVLCEIHNPVSPEKNFSKVLAIELVNDTSDVESLEIMGNCIDQA